MGDIVQAPWAAITCVKARAISGLKLLIDENLSPVLARWVIAFREAGLDRLTQWARLQESMAYVEMHCAGDLVNKVLEVWGSGEFLLREIPV